MSKMTMAELEALNSQLRQIEAEERSRPIPSLAEYKQRCAEAETRRWLERRERDRIATEARKAAQLSTAKQRSKIEAKLASIIDDRSERLAQLDRSRERVITRFAEQEDAFKRALADLDQFENQRVAEELEGTTIEVKVPAVRVGVDHTDTDRRQPHRPFESGWMGAGL